MGKQVAFAATGQDLKQVFERIMDEGWHIWSYTNELTTLQEVVDTYEDLSNKLWIVHDESVLNPQYGKIGYYNSDAVEMIASYHYPNGYGFEHTPAYMCGRAYLQSFRFGIYGQNQPVFMTEMYFKIFRMIKKYAISNHKAHGWTAWLYPEAKSIIEEENLLII